MGLQATKAAATPLAPTTLRENLRLSSEDDHLASQLAAAAVDWAESFTGRAIVTHNCVLTLDMFPPVIRLPRSPLQSVASIQHLDTDGVTQTLAPSLYTVATGEPPRIVPAYGESWPATRSDVDAVTVTFTAGYGTTEESLPDPVRSALLLFCEALLYGDEKGVLQRQAEALLGGYRLGAFAAGAGLDNGSAVNAATVWREGGGW